jgi:hypothetical protein
MAENFDSRIRCFHARGSGEWRADSKTLKSSRNKGN